MDETITQPQAAQSSIPSPMETVSHPFWQHFSKTTLLLIAILLSLTAGLVYLAIRQQQPGPKAHQPLAETPTPSPAHATLSFVQQASTAATLGSVNVMVESNGNRIAGAQLDIAYDPKILSNVTVKSGTFFTNPTPLFNTIDKTNGRISYVLVIPPTGTPATGSGVLATISYTILPTAEKTTKFMFLPKTELTQEGIVGTVLKSATDLTIAIPQNLQISPTASSSGH